MNKTQESVLKIALLYLLFLPKAWAYTSLTPWIDQSGPPNGLIFEPAIGFQSALGANETELNANLNAALSPSVSVYGGYSVQNDDRIGGSARLYQNQGLEVSAQLESTFSHDSHWGFTTGLFGKFSSLEAGLGISFTPVDQSTRLPFSILALHHPDFSGWLYGPALRGEISPSDDQNWVALQLLGGYQTHSGIQYHLTLSLPLTEESARNSTAALIGFMIPFQGSETHEPSFAPYAESMRSNSPPNYDLSAKVVSMNEPLFLLKINKGSSDSITEGQIFDVYSGDELMARAKVLSVKKDEAALNVIEYMQEHWIELGFTARRLSGL